MLVCLSHFLFLDTPCVRESDIRDTVKFKEVMKQYGFGPNGAIMTSLNFFASQFNKVIDLIQKRSDSVSYVILDTPGQIEVFTWSASGTIISESLVSFCLVRQLFVAPPVLVHIQGSAFPTLVLYVMDTPRSHNPVTFMSNMLYACSVLYRIQLPFIVVLNKVCSRPLSSIKNAFINLVFYELSCVTF